MNSRARRKSARGDPRRDARGRRRVRRQRLVGEARAVELDEEIEAVGGRQKRRRHFRSELTRTERVFMI